MFTIFKDDTDIFYWHLYDCSCLHE